MPFPQQNPLAFTRANIENLNPNQLGCYGLYIQGEWIYIGRGDIRQRLLDHLNGDNDLITLNHLRSPDTFRDSSKCESRSPGKGFDS